MTQQFYFTIQNISFVNNKYTTEKIIGRSNTDKQDDSKRENCLIIIT